MAFPGSTPSSGKALQTQTVIFFRKAKIVLIGTYERTKRYQRDFEITSNNIYNQHKNSATMLYDRVKKEMPSTVHKDEGSNSFITPVRSFQDPDDLGDPG